MPEEKRILRIAPPAGVLDTIGDAFLSVDKEWRFTFVNNAAEQLLGKSRDELLGQVVFDLFPNSMGSKGHSEAIRAIEAQRPVQYEQFSEPLQRWYMTSIYPVPDGAVVYFKDISDHKQAEDRDRYLALLLENISDAVLSTDTAMRITSWNKGAERLYGWSEEEVRGRIFPEVVPTEYVHRDSQYVGEQLERRGKWRDEVVQTTKSGNRIHVLSSVTAVKNRHGDTVAFAAVNRDITHRKQSEEVIGRLAAIVESSADAIIGMSLDGTILSWNKAAERLYGWSEPEIVGQSIRAVVPKDRNAEADHLLVQAQHGGRIEDFETVRMHKNGKLLLVSLTISPITDSQGTVIGVATIARDITDRKMSEEALRRSKEQFEIILSGVTDGVIAHDLAGNIVYANDTVARFFGFTTAQELMGAHSQDIAQRVRLLDEHGKPLPKESRPSVVALSGQGAAERIVRFKILASGKEYWTLKKATPAFDQRGEVILTVSIVRGITEQRKAEETLQKSEERFRQLAQTTQVIPWEADAETGTFTYVGAQAEQILGYPLEEWFADTFWSDHIHDEDRDEAVQYCLDSAKDRTEFSFDYRMLAADGRVVWFHDIVNVVHSNGRKILRGLLVDITRQKQATSERETLLGTLQQQRERMDSLVGSVPGVVWEAWATPSEKEQRINFVSDYVETLIGYTVEEWLANPDFAMNIIHPEDRERASREARSFYESGSSGSSQFRWIHKDGHPIWVESQYVTIKDASGNPVGMRGVTMDISGRREQEEHLRILGESSRILASSLEYEQTLNNIAEVLVPALGDWCAIQIIGGADETQQMQQVAIVHKDPAKVEFAKELRKRYPTKHSPDRGVGKVLSTGTSELMPHITDEMIEQQIKDEEYRAIIQGLGFRSAMMVPIKTKDRVWGVITLIHAESGRQYDNNTMKIVEEIGRRAGVAIENAHLYRERENEIAERKKTIKALAESEERFRSLVEQSILSIQIMSPDGRTIQVNKAWEELWGVSWADFQKFNYNMLEDEQLVKRGTMPYIKRAFAGEAVEIPPILYDTAEAGVQGAKRWTEAFIYPIKNEEGKIKEVVLLHEDITDRVQAELHSKERARQQAAAAQLGMFALANSDERAVMDEAVRILAETLDVQYTKVQELLPGEEGVILRAGFGWKPSVKIDETRVDTGLNSQAGFTLKSEEPVVVKDLRTETRFSSPPLLREHGAVSGMTVVIHLNRGPYGVLGVHTTTLREFTDDDVHFLQSIANIISMSIERKEKEQALRESEQRFRDLADSAPVLIWMADTEHDSYYFNKGWLEFTGRGAEEELGRGWLEGIHPEDVQRLLKTYTRSFEQRSTFNIEMRLKRHDGEYRWVLNNGTPRFSASGEFLGYIGSCIDITEHKQNVETIRHQAMHDTLTSLPNRKALEERLTKALADAQANEQIIAIMFLDVDNFKNINDTYGHTAGDFVLKEVGARFRSCVRDDDTVARLGGDEFIIMLTNIYSIDDVLAVANRIFASLRLPINVGTHSLTVDTSIGITLYPTDGSNIHTILKNADRALYRAKEAGKNRYHLYNRAIDRQVSERFTLENELRDAIKRNELVLHYQPIIHTQNKKIVGVEALVRWNHPRLGMIYPNEFIPIAEAMGLIVPLGEWVLREACRQNKQWQEDGLPEFAIAVNLSARQFAEPDMVDMVKGILTETGMDPSCLELEITESVAMGNLDYTINTLKELERMGVHITLDDFGTGYSSLSYLKRFPVHNIKVDQSFVRNCLDDEQDAAIIRTIISMAYSLGLKVIAEGVEKEEQAAFLHTLNCHRLQGYLIARPAPADKLAAWVRREMLKWDSG